MKRVITVWRSDAIWVTRQAEVWVEIAKILNVPVATKQTKGWFKKRTLAIQNILSCMTEEENILLDEQIKEIEEKGYSDEQKQVYIVLVSFLCNKIN